eukprot:13421202-Alexandrium_andersonii.AAC.1
MHARTHADPRMHARTGPPSQSAAHMHASDSRTSTCMHGHVLRARMLARTSAPKHAEAHSQQHIHTPPARACECT